MRGRGTAAGGVIFVVVGFGDFDDESDGLSLHFAAIRIVETPVGFDGSGAFGDAADAVLEQQFDERSAGLHPAQAEADQVLAGLDFDAAAFAEGGGGHPGDFMDREQEHVTALA